jgi:uroporphyrinogen III methyltransferase/synthase
MNGDTNFPHKRLSGKTVVVTRARLQAEDITRELESLGAAVIHIPTIQLLPPDDFGPLDLAISSLEQYDWIIFTSSNAANSFLTRLRQKRSNGLDVLAANSVCAIGSATRRTLEEAGVEVKVVAADSRAEGVLRELTGHIGGEELVRSLKFLIPRSRIARETLPAGLRAMGAKVDAVEAYQTVTPQIDKTTVIRMFEQNRIDAITFTSPSTVSNFAKLVGLNDLSDLLRNTLVACIGPVTAETATGYGLKKITQPDSYSASELVRAIAAAIGKPSQ